MIKVEHNVFSIPFVIIKPTNWNEKKNKFIDIIDKLHINNDEFVETNFDETHRNPDRMNVIHILGDEIKEFENNFDSKFRVTGSWAEISKKNMFHQVHNHGQIGVSAVCFLNFSQKFHTPTVFISPFNNIFTGDLIKYSPDVEEGDILFFPSFLQHYTVPNQSDIVRSIVSFNLEKSFDMT